MENSPMKGLSLLVVLLALPFQSIAFEVSEDIKAIDGLEAAIRAHAAALLAEDNSAIAETVVFPHAQFYPDERTYFVEDASDLPPAGESPPVWRMTAVSLVTAEEGLVIVRASFHLGVGEYEGMDLGSGWWCFTRRAGDWKINWRHYHGRD